MPGLAASLIPALVLTATWAQPSRQVSTFMAFWEYILVGPITYQFRVLNDPAYAHVIHPVASHLTYLYVFCVAFIFAHPLTPRPLTRRLAVTGFAVWYLWATFVINGHEF